MDESESIVKRIAEILDDDYQFDTFLIGAALPAHLYEKEDRIRARFKIRGRENIKSQFMREEEVQRMHKEANRLPLSRHCDKFTVRKGNHPRHKYQNEAYNYFR